MYSSYGSALDCQEEMTLEVNFGERYSARDSRRMKLPLDAEDQRKRAVSRILLATNSRNSSRDSIGPRCKPVLAVMRAAI